MRIEDAVASAARRLPGDDPLGHVFYEERLDSRIVVTSGGRREDVTRFSRGATVVSRATLHASAPAPTDLERLAAAAAAGLPFSERSPAGGAGESIPPDATRLSSGDLRQWLQASMDAAPTGKLHVEATLVEGNQKIWVGRPGGTVATDMRTSRRLEVAVRVESWRGEGHALEERALSPGEGLPDDMVARAAARAVERAEAGRLPPFLRGWRTMRAVFAPGVAGILVHELVGHALEADVVRSARPRLWTSGGAPFPEALIVVDDPRRGRAPWTIDDEGTPPSRVRLIASGRVSGTLSDRSTDVTGEGSSSGHGRRSSYLERILPRMGCTYIEPGPSDPVAILESMGEGIYVSRLAAAEADPRTGRATFVVTDADLIDDGRRTPLIWPFPIVLDAIDSLASIDAIGNDLAFDRCIGSCVRDGQPVATSVGAPTIRLGVVRAYFDPTGPRASKGRA